MSIEKQRLRELFLKVEPGLAKVFGSGWKTHTIYGVLANGTVRVETLDGRKFKRLIVADDGKVLWFGPQEKDGNRETPKTFKMRSLMRKPPRTRNISNLIASKPGARI